MSPAIESTDERDARIEHALNLAICEVLRAEYGPRNSEPLEWAIAEAAVALHHAWVDAEGAP